MVSLFFSSWTVKAENPQVLIETNKGSMIIELYPNEAPISVENFLSYVNSGYYDGTIFHRVIGNFMIQGGGFDTDFNRKPTQAPIQNEADNGLQNRIGTIAMARTNDPHSATSQFFINVANNNSLDFREKTPRAWGYAVFGRVTDGMRTVNQIRGVPTTSHQGHQDVPIEPVIIERARQIK
ncbi:peptidyl-prolyl cis-trans isomerase [Thiomicrospira microaerophila]|nr:peptidylprolyl isomerase [Thiomicrospira microaerophila]UQB43455.1 peptidyl-prolyl cis-trans isomerase [Thiomicrospira microaerophila]